jgi:hypothetical protein
LKGLMIAVTSFMGELRFLAARTNLQFSCHAVK